MKNRLTIAIQKKGRLFDQSADLIKKSGGRSGDFSR